MKRTLIALLTLVVMISLVSGAFAKTTEEKVKDLRKRVQKLEVNDKKDAIQWGGDLRIEAHNITGEVPDYYDGMKLQQLMTSSMFMQGHPDFPASGMNPMDPTDIGNFVAMHYSDYLYFANNLTFAQLKGAVGMMTPDQLGGFMGALTPYTLTEGYKTDNDILYTTRLRLNMDAKVASNVKFSGRLSMYKPWGASTGVGVFNGQANTMAMDVSTPGVPGGETLKVERAYFTWKKIGGTPTYLSLGRRPSTGGPPLHYRHDEMRAGTPMGTVIDFQFDGATLGYSFGEYTTVRACYGLGYESQYGNGTMQADQLKDASFFGFNVDAYNSDKMQIQTTIARAFNVTDGFNGFVIMPNDPVTGNPMPGPIVTRYSPSANLGEIDLASVLLARRDGPIDWFVTGSWMKTRPEDVTTPFGGLMCDPFSTPEEQTGSMYYVGARYNFNNNKTKLGLEWNKGSEYWFNFAPAQDDLIAPKTSTRGTVIEGYVTHRVSKNFVLKLGYINYNYDYSGSGWHLGAPKDLSETQVLGFPTYSKAGKISLGFSARF